MSAAAPTFALPGTWGRVDLSTEESSRRSIRAIADAATRKRDDLANMRHDLRARFETAADIAREGGATDLYIGFELLPGIPLPAWVSVFPRSIDSTDFEALGLGALADSLEIGVRSTGEPASSTRVVDGVEPSIRAVRQSWRRTTHVSEGDLEQDFDYIEADYWLAAAAPDRVALITFSTALAEYEGEMLSLFDAIISTVRWPS